MSIHTHLDRAAKRLAIGVIVGSQLAISAHALNWPNTPLSATVGATPLAMLIAGRDHKLFYEAYNDASDINNDGAIDVRFKPSINYYGLFDSTLCYTYSGNSDSYSISNASNIATENAEMFRPTSQAGAMGTTNFGKCAGANEWSGNWLNYVTTSRIDALRKVLYGGHRDVDSTTQTVLRRAYIPQDAHSWGKEYHSVATDGYDIQDYTPLALPSRSNRRHFFGSLTGNIDRSCATLDNCSNLPPLLRIRRNVGSDKRIWEWASKERPVLAGTLSSGDFPGSTGAEENFTVRVEVCTSTFNNECKRYPNGAYKPIGLLHEYGENNAMLFGLMTGSYDRHMSGGRLRKVVSSFANEVNANTGQLLAGSAPIVDTFNRLRIRGFNQSGSTNEYWKSNPYEDSAKAPTEGQLLDWGNPIGEMLLESARYFAGSGAPLAAFDASGERTHDAAVGLSSATWDDPFQNRPYCSRPNFLVVSDIHPSFDSDQMAGSTFGDAAAPSLGTAGNLGTMNAATYAGLITGIEATSGTSSITGLKFIGESNNVYDSAPTAKNVTSLANIRGLAPEEPTKKGSYYSAAVAYWAKTAGVRNLPKPNTTDTHKVTVDSYVIALSSPLPSFDIPMPNGRTISFVPFAKSVGGSGISAAKGRYQPTNQIVDFYVEQIANSSSADRDTSVNGGYYQATFQINFEDVEQGGDHDMDAIARYVITANSNNTLSVSVTATYQAGGIQQNMGYVISGTTKDGVYLVVRDESNSPAYFLNVPAGREPGYCDADPMPNSCGNLPSLGSTSTFTFTPGASGASVLKGPLWYLAKYGGYTPEDDSTNLGPNRRTEWTSSPASDANPVPNTYFLVQNPGTLKTQLRKALENIGASKGSGSGIIANSTSLGIDTFVFQATFNPADWSGDLIAYQASSNGVSNQSSWNASQRMPLAANRRIVYGSDSTAPNKGKLFLWGNLSPAERALFNNTQSLFNYVRGERTSEITGGTTALYRSRSTILGDIAHSSPVFSSSSETVFIGANDGMLHAFHAPKNVVSASPEAGTELFAYVPSAVMPQLKELAGTSYNANHRFFVDGDLALTPKATPSDRVYLTGLLGRGGKGLFGLDVTDPANFGPADIKWEYFSSTDLDLGYMLGRPIVTRTNNNRQVVLVGNGYNSTRGSAALYVIDVATGEIIRKIATPVVGSNGLATPGTFDLNNDGTTDFVYAGDLFGNVWKFDLSSNNPDNWGLANNSAPVFIARDSTNRLQPITAPMTVMVNPVQSDPNYGQRYVFFGTGKYIEGGDPNPASAGTQTWYSFIDRNLAVGGRANMTQRTVLVTSTFSGKKVRAFSGSTAGDMTNKDGCYIDLPEPGERMVSASQVYKLAEWTLIGSSIIPDASNLCEPGGNGYLNAINPFTCARLSLPFFDINEAGGFADDVINLADGSTVNIGSVDLGVGMPGQALLIGDRLVVGGSKGIVEDVRVNTGVTALKGRLSWREIIRD
jgi:type IV pilus assembly protein PilY1